MTGLGSGRGVGEHEATAGGRRRADGRELDAARWGLKAWTNMAVDWMEIAAGPRAGAGVARTSGRSTPIRRLLG